MKKILLSSIIIFCSVVSYSQWQPDVRLTYDGAQSYMSGPHQNDIASSGNILHVVWHDERSNWDIYYKRSTDAGVSWSADTRLSNGSGESHGASVAVSGSIVHVVWYDNRDGHWEIYYTRSTDSGLSWSTDTRFTSDDSFLSVNPVVAVSGSDVHVIWGDERDGNSEIYYRRSTNYGSSWEPETRLTNNSYVCESPSITASGLFVHTVWYDTRDGNFEIYYKRSTDGGTSWGADTRLSSTPFVSELSHIAASGSIVHVAWQDDRDGSNKQIYYRRSTDAGASWESEIHLSNNAGYAAAPNISLSGSNVHITWQDNRDGNFEVYYKRSTDNGINWGSDTRLTNASGNSLRTFSSVIGTIVHVVWMDERDGNWEIYYKQDPTGNPSLPPQPPVLVSPLNNTIGLPLTDTLIWNSVSGAVSYRLQAAVDAGFSTLIINDSTLTTTSKIVSGLSQLTTYYWRVNAKNSGGTSGWSPVWNFRTKGVPTTVTLLLPPNNTVNVPVTYTFRWSKAFDQTALLSVSNYWFERVTDTVMMTNLLRDTTLTDTSKVVTGMSSNTTYFWRVKAKNEIGWSNFASWFKFTTVLNVPSAPVLSSPPNAFYNQTSTVRFTWFKSLYAVSYRLQVATDSLFTNLIVNDSTITDSTLLVINFTVNSYYWWRVNAKNAAGISQYSAVWKFGTFMVGLKEISTDIPKEFSLYNNYPNPFNPVSKIKFDIAKMGNVKLTIYDMLGREAAILVNVQLNAGTYEAVFDGMNYPSGVYFYKIETETFVQTRRMVLLK
jgi:hypothetical protein